MATVKRRDFIKQVSLGMTALATGTLSGSCSRKDLISPDSSQRPNILFIITDNQRWDLMGCSGNPLISTPNMDRLAELGVRFSQTFVTTPICTASRASLLTGLYERTHGFNFLTPPFRADLAAKSYPALMRTAGYRTGFIGKFGLGVHPNLEIENEEVTVPNMFDHFDHYHFWPDGYILKQPDGSEKHLTDLTEEKAINFLNSGSPDQPFCLTLSFNAPHALDDDPRQYIWPKGADGLYEDVTFPDPVNSDPAFFEALPEFIRESESRRRWYWRFDTPEKFQDMTRGLYRMISGVDMAIGNVMQYLEKMGIADNTVVIFMSDNGMFYGERGLSDCWTMHEESIHVPLIIYDPREPVDHRSRVVDEMVLNVDIPPTLLELAGIESPTPMHGSSLLPFLKGQNPELRQDFFCEHLFQSPEPDVWKDSASPIPKSEGVRSKQWKYIRWFEQQPIYEELYDLKNDPHESINLANDPQYSTRLEELRSRCDQLRDLYTVDKADF